MTPEGACSWNPSWLQWALHRAARLKQSSDHVPAQASPCPSSYSPGPQCWAEVSGGDRSGPLRGRCVMLGGFHSHCQIQLWGPRNPVAWVSLGVWHLYKLFPLAYSQLSQSLPGGSDQVKNLPTMMTWVQSLGREDSLEKGMATHSSILAWRIPWTEEPGRL